MFLRESLERRKSEGEVYCGRHSWSHGLFKAALQSLMGRASQMAWRSGEPGLGVCGVWAESLVVAPRMTKARQMSIGRMDELGFITGCYIMFLNP